MNRVIELDGRAWALRFTVNAVCCLEERMGGGLETLLHTQVSSVRALLWCGLMDGQPGLTLEAAGDLLQAHLARGGCLRTVADALAGALEDAGFFRDPGPGGAQAAP